jgi:hypothetical protein
LKLFVSETVPLMRERDDPSDEHSALPIRALRLSDLAGARWPDFLTCLSTAVGALCICIELVLHARMSALLSAISEAPAALASGRADELALAGLLLFLDRLMTTVPAGRSLTTAGIPGTAARRLALSPSSDRAGRRGRDPPAARAIACALRAAAEHRSLASSRGWDRLITGRRGL